jgi:hypothetical protein
VQPTNSHFFDLNNACQIGVLKTLIIEHENILSIYIQDTYTKDYLYITVINKNIDRNRIRIRSLFKYRKNKTGMHVYTYIPSGRLHPLTMRLPRCCSRRCTHVLWSVSQCLDDTRNPSLL